MSGLGDETKTLDRGLPLSIGNGLYVNFDKNGDLQGSDTWTIDVPNEKSPNYTTLLNAYQSALQTKSASLTSAQSQIDSAQATLVQAQANLALQQTAARPEDVAAAKALLDSANAQEQLAASSYTNGLIIAPANGTVSSVDAKVGEVAGPSKPSISLISSGNYQVETYIGETELTRIKINDAAEITLDAYGNLVPFEATVITIDPAGTLQNGVQSYKTTLQFSMNDPRIKEGMSANVTIIDQQKENVLVVSTGDIFNNGKTKFVLVDDGAGHIKEQNITIGLEGVDGMDEITSGLTVGAKIAIFGN